MSNKNALKCKTCAAIWTRQTILDDACPTCGGEIVDITHTNLGKEFLSIIEMPAELRSTNKQAIYATGPSSLISPNDWKQS